MRNIDLCNRLLYVGPCETKPYTVEGLLICVWTCFMSGSCQPSNGLIITHGPKNNMFDHSYATDLLNSSDVFRSCLCG